MNVNKLILGDNFDVMKGMESESVDLVYLDPPFFSNRNYEVIWGDEGEIRSFQDRWAGGIDHYIAWLKERVAEMHRLLKPTGSIFLHCDWHADAYIRVHILDKIFGAGNFRNEIIWCYTGPGSPGMRQFNRKSDTIFWYSKSDAWTFNRDDILLPYKDGKVHSGGFIEKDGARLDPEDYSKGKIPENWWADIAIAARYPKNSANNLGYPTQKPEKLLDRIIKAASNEGDVVLDPFIGGGTTVAVADRLNRCWIGIDQSPMAIKVTDFRLQRQQAQTNLFNKDVLYTLQLHKYDYDALLNKDAFEFENWIIQQFGGVPQGKKGGDKGVDGKAADGAPIQVKRSENISRDVIDKFPNAAERYDENLFGKNQRENKPVGYIIAFSFSKGAVEEVARLKNHKNIIIKLVKVEDIVPVSCKPKIKVDISDLDKDENGDRLIKFTVRGESPAGIEFYSWDFAFDEKKGFSPSVIIDKDGRQTVALKSGTHNIAVKIVDNDGLENMEVIELKINGVVRV